jgi:hypothetical protein
MAIDAADLGTQPDLTAMARWVAWVHKLVSHAALCSHDTHTLRTLTGAADDATSLRDALSAATTGWLDREQTGVLRSIYDLWDANLPRFELLASGLDTEWYEMWRLRSASARLRAAGSLLDESPLDAIA